VRRRRSRDVEAGIACQLLFAGVEGSAVLLDVIALDPLVEGDDIVPAGTPVTLLLEPDGGPGSPSHDLLVRTVERWASSDSVFRFDTTAGSQGRRYVLATGAERLVLEVTH
jgi:hypothetical protein